MNETETKAIIFQLLKTIAPETVPEELDADENIQQALEIDSFDFLQFIIGLDEKLKLKTPEEDYTKITTLNNLLSYIQSVREHPKGLSTL